MQRGRGRRLQRNLESAGAGHHEFMESGHSQCVRENLSDLSSGPSDLRPTSSYDDTYLERVTGAERRGEAYGTY